MAETAPDLNPELPGDNLSSEEIQAEIWVFKMGLIVEQMQMVSLWTVKASFLIGYGRLTSVPPVPLSLSSYNTIVLTKTNVVLTGLCIKKISMSK